MSDFFPVDGRPDRASVKRTLVLVFVIALVLGNLGGGVRGITGALGTGAHEAGHALFGDLLTGRVTSVTVFQNGGGVTFTESSDVWWRTFLVAGAGYPATLFAGLALLTAVLFGRATRITAGVAAGLSMAVWVFWVPFNSRIPFVTDGEQRFTWILMGVTTLAFATVAVIPDRYEAARRIGLGVLAVGLLTDAFSAGRTLVVVEGSAGETASDADALSQAIGVGSSTVWAWLLRGSLFVFAFVWAQWALNRAGERDHS